MQSIATITLSEPTRSRRLQEFDHSQRELHGVLAQVRSLLADLAVEPRPTHTALLERAVAEALASVAQALATGQTRLVDATPDPLTAREREVVAFVARGASNRQIADQLVIGERTVESHVSHALNKLGLRTRAQLAVWAIDRQASNGLTSLPAQHAQEE